MSSNRLSSTHKVVVLLLRETTSPDEHGGEGAQEREAPDDDHGLERHGSHDDRRGRDRASFEGASWAALGAVRDGAASFWMARKGEAAIA
jgi:hypothetical protein